MKVSSRKVAQAAEDAVKLGITYQQEMCDVFVRNTVKRAGGDMGRYAGSNDMFRNACESVHELDMAIREGLLSPGCVLFIVEYNGKEPPQYQEDGLGNASHIGFYTGIEHEVVHSSASKGGVVPSTLKSGWTHVGWLKAVDYIHEAAPDFETPQAEVVAESGDTVRMREEPSLHAKVLKKVPVGSIVKVLNQEPDWWQIWWDEKVGWMMSKFLRMANAPQETPEADQSGYDTVSITLERDTARALAKALNAALS